MKMVYFLLAEHPFDSLLICFAHHSRSLQASFGILVLIPHAVGGISLKTLYFTGSGNFKTLFSTAMGLHLWHDQ
jgi:hypothetical protein